MSPKLLAVAERARRDPHAPLRSLAHLIDEVALERAYQRLRPRAAPGIDGMTKAEYGRNLSANLQQLHQRLKQQRYRHQPLRRAYLPKPDGRKRPIGIATVEDKIVQGALAEVLGAAYEPVFSTSSYGFRPGRSAHDAIRVLVQSVDKGGKVRWILESDVESFFDRVDRSKLMEILRERIADESLLRGVGKCLRAGVLDGEEYSEPEKGTPQGSSLSPLLGNIYLHHALDAWFEAEVKPRMGGEAVLIRFGDDFILGFERREDAERVWAVLGKRMARYGLTLHPAKTRLVPFGRPPRGGGPGKAQGVGTFDFLGFTWYWRRNRRGTGWYAACKTRSGRLRRAIQSVNDFCRSHRHESMADQHRALKVRLQGHYNYFGVNDNVRSLRILCRKAERAWHKWLCRRSQKAYIPWLRFREVLRRYPLPRPRVCVQIWERKGT